MGSFITRVELHDATYQNYVQLHEFMRQEGFTTTIQGNDGFDYHLPPAEYHLSANRTAQQVRELASHAADKTRKQSSVFTSEYSSAAWIGLNKVKAAA